MKIVMEYITIRLKEVHNIFGQHMSFNWRWSDEENNRTNC